MTSIGTQAREAAARSQSEAETGLDAANEKVGPAAKNTDKPTKKPTARERVAATAEAVFANRYMPGAKIHNASDVMLSELRDRTLDRSTGGEGDLTERDAFKTISKLAHQSVQMPMGGLVMAVRHEYQEAAGTAEKPAETKEGSPPLVDQIKKSFQDGLQSTKPAARRRNDGGMEL